MPYRTLAWVPPRSESPPLPVCTRAREEDLPETWTAESELEPSDDEEANRVTHAIVIAAALVAIASSTLLLGWWRLW